MFNQLWQQQEPHRLAVPPVSPPLPPLAGRLRVVARGPCPPLPSHIFPVPRQGSRRWRQGSAGRGWGQGPAASCGAGVCGRGFGGQEQGVQGHTHTRVNTLAVTSPVTSVPVLSQPRGASRRPGTKKR